jgi:hypothetical protein
MENIEQISNLFFIKYALWIILTFTGVFFNGKKFFNLCIFLLFIIIFFLQEDNTDLFYYKKSYIEYVYYGADIGFIWLQLFLKNLPLTYEVSFNILKLSSFFLLFFIPKKNRNLIYIIFASQFFFLAIFNNLRQGIACTLILIGLLNLFDNKKKGLIFLFLSPFFHTSSLLILILIIFFKRIHFINNAYNLIFLIIVSFIFFLLTKFTSEQLELYNEYFKGYTDDETGTRTNPYYKQLLIFIYLIILTELKYLKSNDLISLLIKLRIILFLMSTYILFLTNSNDLAGRILYYFYAFDALYFSYLIYKFKLSLPRKLIYFFSVILSPSVTTILSL